jgi:hypothetical protein
LGQLLGEVNPLHHSVQLVRDAVFGFAGWEDLARFGALFLFGLAQNAILLAFLYLMVARPGAKF